MIFHRPSTRFVWQAEIVLPLAVVIILFVFSFAQMGGENPAGPALRVTLIQPSVPQTLIWDESENTNRFQQLLQLSETALTRPSATLSTPKTHLIRPAATFSPSDAEKGNPMGEGHLPVEEKGSRRCRLEGV
jgi:apolipoprotein N-acyltransferase